MGSLEERAVLEFEEESLVRPSDSASASGKTHSREGHPLPSPASQTSCSKCLSNSIFNSLKVVVFSTKINLLVPFGPVAILVDKFTDNHVSCILSSHAHRFGVWIIIHHIKNIQLFSYLLLSAFQGWVFFLSLLGIIPLAERLGYATE